MSVRNGDQNGESAVFPQGERQGSSCSLFGIAAMQAAIGVFQLEWLLALDISIATTQRPPEAFAP